MRVLLSIGPGRLHFMPAAAALKRQGIELTLLLGWKAPGWLVRRVPRLAARMVPPELDCRSCAVAEMLGQAAVRGARLLHLPTDGIEALGWRGYGWASRRHIRDAAILHVRSGAGRGGAIRKARRLGMKVLADHSIAHPAFLAEQVGGEFTATSRFWRQTLQDCEEADLVLVNSDFVRETFVQHGFPSEKLRVAYLGVEPAYAGLRQVSATENRPLNLLFVGHFGHRKGADILLEAMRLLDAQGVKCGLDVVGSVAAGLPRPPSNVVFHGLLASDGVRRFLKQADILVFPTLAEGCARAVMEAMAAGVCVVTTAASGAPVTDGETGYLVPVRDAAALAGKIGWLDGNRPLIDAAGSAAAGLVARGYTWEAYAREVEAVYRELLRPPSGCNEEGKNGELLRPPSGRNEEDTRGG
ncbi:MAG: glycosyltransferase family 4 protein [Kiritimatiellia bacterium]